MSYGTALVAMAAAETAVMLVTVAVAVAVAGVGPRRLVSSKKARCQGCICGGTTRRRSDTERKRDENVTKHEEAYEQVEAVSRAV